MSEGNENINQLRRRQPTEMSTTIRISQSSSSLTERKSSIVNSSYALLQSLPSYVERIPSADDTRLTAADSSETYLSFYSARDDIDPYISSLRKSVKILNQALKQQQQQSDNNDRPSSKSSSEDTKKHKITTKTTRTWCTRTHFISILHLSAYAILGTLLRVFLDRLFGGECLDDTTPWLHSFVTKINLCVTSNGQNPPSSPHQPGGAIFSDLPANMIGCFLMGLLQPSPSLGLLSDAPIAFLDPNHWFQSWGVIHLGLRTGFCGSLTTLASWNTQMVVMMDGTMAGGYPQFFSAVFGYIIGLQVSLASFAFGKNVAIWIHRYKNPHLAREEDIYMYAYAADKDDGRGLEANDQFVKVKALADYEERYLRTLLPRERLARAKINVSSLEDLERWKVSTDEYRMTRDSDDSALVALHEIERRVLMEEQDPGEELREVARKYGWDVEAIERFAKDVNKYVRLSAMKTGNDDKSKDSLVMQKVWVSVPIIMAVLLLSINAILAWKKEGIDFYEGAFFDAIFSPMGAIMRWKLSSFNGSLNGSWNWLPIGTLSANVIASTISATMEGIVLSRELNDVTIHVLSAIKTGFAGCLSTVSTFVAEGSMLQTTFPHHAKASFYMVGTLLLTCIAGLVFYCPIVHSSTQQ